MDGAMASIMGVCAWDVGDAGGWMVLTWWYVMEAWRARMQCKQCPSGRPPSTDQPENPFESALIASAGYWLH